MDKEKYIKEEEIQANNLRTLRETANEAIKQTKSVASYFIYRNGVMFFFGCNKEMRSNWQEAEQRYKNLIACKGLEIVLYTDVKAKVFKEPTLLEDPRSYTPEEAEELKREMIDFVR